MIKKKKSGLSKRYEQSYATKNSGGGGRRGVMKWKEYDGDIQFFSPAMGRNRINIIPYEIKSKNHPLVKRGEFEIGDKDYVMDIFVHRNVGPSEASVVCLKQNYGKPCPICEQADAFRKQGKEKEAKDLKPSRRCFYNVEDCKEPGKLKIFEASHHLFEKELIDEARDDEEGGFVDFADPDSGKEIKFRCSKVSQGGFEFNEFKSFSFEDREESISEDLLDKAVSFDEILDVPSYEEIEKILFGQDDDEEDEDKPKPKTSKNHDDDDEDEDNEDDEEEEVKKPSKKKVVEEDDDEEEEELPKKKSKKVDDEEDEEEPPKKSKSCSKCPFGHTFGDDCDDYDDCDECDVWDKCARNK